MNACSPVAGEEARAPWLKAVIARKADAEQDGRSGGPTQRP